MTKRIAKRKFPFILFGAVCLVITLTVLGIYIVANSINNAESTAHDFEALGFKIGHDNLTIATSNPSGERCVVTDVTNRICTGTAYYGASSPSQLVRAAQLLNQTIIYENSDKDFEVISITKLCDQSTLGKLFGKCRIVNATVVLYSPANVHDEFYGAMLTVISPFGLVIGWPWLRRARLER